MIIDTNTMILEGFLYLKGPILMQKLGAFAESLPGLWQLLIFLAPSSMEPQKLITLVLYYLLLQKWCHDIISNTTGCGINEKKVSY